MEKERYIHQPTRRSLSQVEREREKREAERKKRKGVKIQKKKEKNLNRPFERFCAHGTKKSSNQSRERGLSAAKPRERERKIESEKCAPFNRPNSARLCGVPCVVLKILNPARVSF